MTEMSTAQARELFSDVTQFLWHEGDILDRRDYDAWLELWNPEGLYIMPIGEGPDYENQLNLCYDNDKMRRQRVDRFQRGFSISSAPPAITIRTISRIVIDSVEGDVINVRAAEHLIEDKFGRQRVWAGEVVYRLLKTETGFMLDRKVITLLNSDGMLNSFSYLF